MSKKNGNGEHPKSYSRFNLSDVEHLGLEVKVGAVFSPLPSPLPPSPWLVEALENEPDILLDSEDGKSGFIVAPIVRELAKRNRGRVSVYPGYAFDVAPELGLAGFCDFILSKSPGNILVKAPVFFIVEAKNENLSSGAGQCIAEMYAAQVFNQRAGKPMDAIYGVVTWGQQWQFYKLSDQTVIRDNAIYTLSELDMILGMLQAVVDAT